jgi:hypothetical protein
MRNFSTIVPATACFVSQWSNVGDEYTTDSNWLQDGTRAFEALADALQIRRSVAQRVLNHIIAEGDTSSIDYVTPSELDVIVNFAFFWFHVNHVAEMIALPDFFGNEGKYILTDVDAPSDRWESALHTRGFVYSNINTGHSVMWSISVFGNRKGSWSIRWPADAENPTVDGREILPRGGTR